MLLDRGRYSLALLDSLGAPPRALTTEGYEFPVQRPWSPDGREVLYVSSRTGAEDLWVIDVESGVKRQLTNDLRRDYAGAWSADGKWVAFQSERGRQADIWLVAASGGEAHRVTDTPELENLVGWRGSEMALVYAAQSGTGSMQVVPVAGGAERQLTPDSITVDYFELSPDASQAVVTDFRGGSDLDIYVMPSSGGPLRLLASVQASEPRVHWSPDGKQIAFLSNTGGTPDPWILDVATGATKQLLDWDTNEYTPTWGSDASALYVVSDRDAAFGDLWRVPLDGGAPTRVTTNGRVDAVVTMLDGGTRPVVTLLGGEGGRIGIGEVMPDGALREIPVATSVDGVAWSTTVDSDSLAISVEGSLRSMMISRRDGGGRPLGSDGARASYWSRDGKSLLFSTAAGSGRDIEVMEVATGKVRRLTNGGGSNVGPEFSPAGDLVFFRRDVPVSRIAVADVGPTLSVKP
jgi:Tol biopolymer transport system component